MGISIHLYIRYVSTSLEYLFGSGLAGSDDNYITFWGATRLFCKVATPFYIPISNVWRFQFHIFDNTCYGLFYFSYHSRCETMDHWIKIQLCMGGHMCTGKYSEKADGTDCCHTD
jgi:hypothetical protein